MAAWFTALTRVSLALSMAPWLLPFASKPLSSMEYGCAVAENIQSCGNSPGSVLAMTSLICFSAKAKFGVGELATLPVTKQIASCPFAVGPWGCSGLDEKRFLQMRIVAKTRRMQTKLLISQKKKINLSEM